MTMTAHAESGPWPRRGFGGLGFDFDPARLFALAEAASRRAGHGGHGGHKHGHGGRGWRGQPGWPFGGGMPGPGFGRGPKVARGDVREALLALLAESPMHGYQMIGEIAERSGGAWRPSPGSVYPVLQLLADEGLVRAEEADGKRVFHLTDAGRAHVAARAGGTKPWDTAAAGADDDVTALRTLAFGIGAAVVQVAQTGSTAQVDAAREVLAETRRALYRILAEDGSDPEPPFASDSGEDGDPSDPFRKDPGA
jgi:DNA-binding PadR family transcriptional regulator